MKDQIVKLLAGIKVEKVNWKNETVLIPAEWPIDVNEIAAAIAPLVNTQAQDFAGWICHQGVAGRTYHKLWLDYCEEKAIAPHLEAGAGWEDAPEWAGWRLDYSDGSHNFSKGYPSIITDGVIKVECRPK